MKKSLKFFCYVFFALITTLSLITIVYCLVIARKYSMAFDYNWPLQIISYIASACVGIFGIWAVKSQNKTNLFFNKILVILFIVFSFFSSFIFIESIMRSQYIYGNSVLTGIIQLILLAGGLTILLPIIKNGVIRVRLLKILAFVTSLLAIYNFVITIMFLYYPAQYHHQYDYLIFLCIKSVIDVVIPIMSIVFVFKINDILGYHDMNLYKVREIAVSVKEKNKNSTTLKDSNKSYFNGNVLQYLGWTMLCFLVNVVTLGILYPITVCWMINWKYKHTIYDGYRLMFNGNGVQLLGRWILWMFLTVITIGIYGIFLPVKMEQWKAKHTHLIEILPNKK